jgi:GNAT superfamily N-acetyltransferase
VQTQSGQTVAMGRVIGDGGWYFLVADMATLPEHQKKGLGRAVLSALLDEITDRAPAGASVTLMADPPGQRLYEQLGFERPTNGSISMHRRVG